MTTDPWGQPLSCSAEVADTWAEAMERYHARRSGDVAMVKRVVEADPGFAVARATAALLAVFMAADFDAAAEVAAAEAGRAEHAWERSFVSAAKATVEQGRWPAKKRWLAHHDDHPGDLMGLSVAVFLLIMGTESDGPDQAEERGRRSMEHVGETAMLLGFLGDGGPGPRRPRRGPPARDPIPRAAARWVPRRPSDGARLLRVRRPRQTASSGSTAGCPAPTRTRPSRATWTGTPPCTIWRSATPRVPWRAIRTAAAPCRAGG